MRAAPLPKGPDCHLHMRRLRHFRMPTSLVHARTSAASLVHAHTFLAVFVGIILRIWSFGFRVLGVSGFSGFRGGVVMTFVLLEHMACHGQDTCF